MRTTAQLRHHDHLTVRWGENLHKGTVEPNAAKRV